MFSVGGVMIIFLLLFAANLDESEASGDGEIKFKRFRYDNCGDASGVCDFYFVNIKIVGGDRVEHTIGRKKAPDDSNNVDLTIIIPDVTTIKLAINGTVTISLKVYDSDWGLNEDDLINNIHENVNFSIIALGDDWTDKTYTYNNGAQLTISYQIKSCDAHFTGPGCNFCTDNYYTYSIYTSRTDTYYCTRYCSPVARNYTCSSTGDKVCVTWKTGANCDQCVTGRTGLHCDQCQTDYYGAECSVYCQSRAGQYSCSDDGTKVCDSQWTGTNCDACSTGYYGNSCSTYCSPTEHYNCSYNGEKTCLSGNTTIIGSSCTPSTSGLDIKVIGGAGGGGLFVMIIIVAIVTVCLVRRRKLSVQKTEQQSNMMIANPTFHADNNTLDIPQDNQQAPVYSTVNKAQEGYSNPTADDGTTYADLAFVKGAGNGTKCNDATFPNRADNTTTYADFAFSNKDTNEATYADVTFARPAQTTYADLSFVKNTRCGDEASTMYADGESQSSREPGFGRESADVTYLTVTELKE